MGTDSVGLDPERRMENQQQRTGASLILSLTPRTWVPDERSMEECRNLIQILTEKNNQLYEECRSDQNKVRHIRVIGSSLDRLNPLISRLENRHLRPGPSEVLVDSRGIMYESVRSCDLERICDK